MYFDSVVVLSFLDFSSMKSSVCINCVQVSGRHRLNYDYGSKGVNSLTEIPVNRHTLLVLEA